MKMKILDHHVNAGTVRCLIMIWHEEQQWIQLTIYKLLYSLWWQRMCLKNSLKVPASCMRSNNQTLLQKTAPEEESLCATPPFHLLHSEPDQSQQTVKREH